MNTIDTTTRHAAPARRAGLTAAALLLASLAVAGCDSRDGDPTVGTKVDRAIERTEQKADEIKADASRAASELKTDAGRATEEAKTAAGELTKDAKQATANAVDKVEAKLSDAGITTAVNAELAKDADLSALKINVDTMSGKVALRGTAPSAAAKERATTLAMGVKGVSSVDNQLAVQPAKM